DVEEAMKSGLNIRPAGASDGGVAGSSEGGTRRQLWGTNPLPGALQDSEGPLGHGLAGGRKPVAQWTVPEVCAWLSNRALGAQGPLVQAARSHAISGRALLRLTEGTLQRMGVAPGSQRRQLLQEVLQLRVQQEVQELLDIADGEGVPLQGVGGSPCRGWGSRPQHSQERLPLQEMEV
uniref:SAM domain-containing protein n=1 Tax=Terrapene triunguis TaxID=2587831 RepID=A0A674K234_9SAUR